MEHIGIRIKRFREAAQLTQADVFRDTGGVPQGVKQTTLSSIESGTEPKYGVVAALLKAYPQLNPEWLLHGNGSMLRDGKSLTPLEAPAQAPSKQTQAPTMHVVAESELVRELKEDRNYWREMALALMGRDQGSETPKKQTPDSFAAEVVQPIIPAGFGAGRGARHAAVTTMHVGSRIYSFSVADQLLVIGNSEEEAA